MSIGPAHAKSARSTTLNAALGFVRSRVPTAAVGNWQACGEGIVELALDPWQLAMAPVFAHSQEMELDCHWERVIATIVLDLHGEPAPGARLYIGASHVIRN